ncbi:phospholipid carrier-dependent glycosyltransferase [Streptomyces orinoci]|uniref:Phospholipid carrier-dependent glycosyltransferase n=1 Tax=Streptomyces orinoci TaxID=67339 RepID=A0ABV3JQ77_STRON|nr:phospholipid carrier-dependent glycosyltransferase [Streptomyces orinoci]
MPPPAPRPPVLGLRTSRPDLLVCAAVLAAIVCVQGWNITGFPALSDDEGTYLAQAWAVQQDKGLAHYTYWYDHPPLGWLQLAVVTWLPSVLAPATLSVAPMRPAMLLVTAVSAVLLFALARRLGLPRWAAALAMALFGLSPLAVVLQREIFLDNIAVLWMLLAFFLAASPRRHLWHHFGAGLAAAVSVLSKETMLVVLPALLVTMWRHSHRDTRKFAVTGAVTACGLIGLTYPLYALLNNELFPGPGHVSLIDGIKYQLNRAGSGFILDPHSGAHAALHSWLYYDTVLPLGGPAATVLLLASARWSVTGRALAGPALAAAILALVALRPSGYLPAMYIIQALPFLALSLAGVAASVTHAVLRGRLPMRRPARRLAVPGAPSPQRPVGRLLGRASGDAQAVAGAVPGGVLAGTTGTSPRAAGLARTGLQPVRRGGTRNAPARRTVVAALAAGCALLVVPRWYHGDRIALTADANSPYRQAASWLGDTARVPRPARTRVLADDAIWLDLVHSGYRPGTGVIWFYKADLDPAVGSTLPHGWRDLDYVVASPTVRRDAATLPLVRAALRNSRAVAVFGAGVDRIEIRRVNRAGR